MSNIFQTPNMNLPSPIPGAEPGPQWSTDNYNCFNIVDSHNHAPGSGVQITPDGIDINSDLTFNNTNSALSLLSSQYTDQASPISGSIVSALYSSTGELFWNDGSGNQVQLTSGGSPAGGAGTITGLPSGTASAAYASGTGTFVFQQSTSTGANMDIGTLILRYPGSYPSPSGNHISLEVPSSVSTGYALTLPALPSASNSFLTISTSGVISSSLTVDNSTIDISGSTIEIKPQGVTQAQISPRGFSTGTATNGQVFSSSSSGAFTTGSTSLVQVTNLTGIVVTGGNQIQIMLCPDGNTLLNQEALVAAGSNNGVLSITRNGTVIAQFLLGFGYSYSPGAFNLLDFPAAGTYTYAIKVKSPFSGTVEVKNCVLNFFEIK